MSIYYIHPSTRVDRARPLYLPVTSMTILTRVSTLVRACTLRPWRDSPGGPGSWCSWIVPNSSKEPRTLRIVLEREPAIYCVFEIMQSSGCRLPRRWLLCTSIHFFLSLFFSFFFVFFFLLLPCVHRGYSERRFRRYRHDRNGRSRPDNWQLNAGKNWSRTFDVSSR